jgi:hypothetical protein
MIPRTASGIPSRDGPRNMVFVEIGSANPSEAGVDAITTTSGVPGRAPASNTRLRPGSLLKSGWPVPYLLSD